ncbi:hypothetical protein BC830DRAFT_913576 [Chytriomyces sp. MP71]|nr:hypothetical protein BC830DRAFT_913576 [Chytriomyces sp. MP71]
MDVAGKKTDGNMSAIVQVVSKTATDEGDEDLERLARIPSRRSLQIKSTEAREEAARGRTTSFRVLVEAAHTQTQSEKRATIHLHSHARTIATNVATTQSHIGDHIVATDEFCASIISTVSARVSQAKGRMDAVNKAASVRKCAETTRTLLDDILHAIADLDPFLLPNERLDSQENINRYPKLTKMRSSSPKRAPSLDRSRNSSIPASPAPESHQEIISNSPACSIMIPPRRTSSRHTSPAPMDDFPSNEALAHFTGRDVGPFSSSVPNPALLAVSSAAGGSAIGGFGGAESPTKGVLRAGSYDASVFPKRSSSLHSRGSLNMGSGSVSHEAFVAALSSSPLQEGRALFPEQEMRAPPADEG